MTTAVVIPYYQKSPGILARALRSVVAQQQVSDVRIIVVDDESPAPARAEIATIEMPEGFSIQLIEQKNGGPAAARNTGLAAIAADVAYVAFVDSDDEWSATHLTRAVAALHTGCDFYFADLYQLEQSISAFARSGRIHVHDHLQVPEVPNLYLFQGDMKKQIITGNVIGTSTVVFRREKFADLRFDEAFLNAGEDYLFWIACALQGARFCFSTVVEATYGEGVNVYAGSGWDSETFLDRVHHEMKYRKHLLTAFSLDREQRAFVVACVEKLRTEFAAGIIHRVRCRLPMDRELLKSQLLLDPLTLFRIPTVAGESAAGWLKRRR